MSSEVQQILIAVRSLCEKDQKELVSALDRELHGSPSRPNRELIEAIRGKYAIFQPAVRISSPTSVKTLYRSAELDLRVVSAIGGWRNLTSIKSFKRTVISRSAE